MRAFEIINEGQSQFERLKANKVPLTDEEREKVMKSGAVWYHGPKETPVPAIWKSVDEKGNVKYVCNTHRAFQAKDTLDAAIKAYEFIEQTA